MSASASVSCKALAGRIKCSLVSETICPCAATTWPRAFDAQRGQHGFVSGTAARTTERTRTHWNSLVRGQFQRSNCATRCALSFTAAAQSMPPLRLYVTGRGCALRAVGAKYLPAWLLDWVLVWLVNQVRVWSWVRLSVCLPVRGRLSESRAVRESVRSIVPAAYVAAQLLAGSRVWSSRWDVFRSRRWVLLFR